VQTNCCADLSETETAPSTAICPRAYGLFDFPARRSNFAALASAFAVAAANLAATFCSEAS